VQTLRLIDLLQQIVAGGNLALDAHHIPPAGKPVLARPTTPLHLLNRILGMVLKIHENPTELQIDSSVTMIVTVGTDLDSLGMTSEAIAWQVLAVQILRYSNSCGWSVEVLPPLAYAHYKLSTYYRYQMRYKLALQASEQALRIWRHLWPNLLQSDIQAYSAALLVNHAANLRETGGLEPAISVAEEAVTLCRPMVKQIIQSGAAVSPWSEEEFQAVLSPQALFILAKSLASADRHVEAYLASKEGFQIVLGFSGSTQPPDGEHISSFIQQICKAAEEDGLSLPMIADSVVLFRNLAHLYPQEFSSQFLCLLHAYLYLREQKTSLDLSTNLKRLCIFLEPDNDSPLPILIATPNLMVELGNLNPSGGVDIEDAVRIYFLSPSDPPTGISPLIQNIFIVHFRNAITILRVLISSFMANPSSESDILINRAFGIIRDDILQIVTRSSQLVLIEIMGEIVSYFQATPTSTPQTGWSSIDAMVCDHSQACWIVGLLDNALAVVDEVIERRRLCFNAEDADDVDQLRWFHLHRAFVLYDMGRIPEAIAAVREVNKLLLPSELTAIDGLFLCLLQTRILQRTGRTKEALKFLKRAVSNADRGYWTENPELYSFYSRNLLAELTAIREHMGHLGRALGDAERGVAICRRAADGKPAEHRKHGLVYYLSIFSSCLASVGREEEALVAIQEATSIYIQDAPRMWGNFAHTVRRQELGARCLHSLSLRLATQGWLDEALDNAKKANKLYRELVLLAPVHMPSLASSLRNLAQILRKLDLHDESIAACEEAASILRKVAKTETYFLVALVQAIDELTGYLSEKGDTERASRVISESIEVRAKIAALPPEPDFIFEEIEIKSEEEEDTVFRRGEEKEWETATESDQEYYDLTEEGGIPVPFPSMALAAFTEPQSKEIEFPAARETPIMDNIAQAAMSVKNCHGFADLLTTEVKVRPVDILWSLLLVVLGIAISSLWNRI
jgi:tetratricopeptide (TPR) repeat protein